jgi:PAS domain S-box-containing protein
MTSTFTPSDHNAETLREALLDIERAKMQEHAARLISEQMVACLQTFTTYRTAEEVIPALIHAMRPVLNFTEAMVLVPQGHALIAAFSTSNALTGSLWPCDGVFARVSPNRPLALFDCAFVPEWKNQPFTRSSRIRSSIIIALREAPKPAYLVCVHHDVGFFGKSHLQLAGQFAPLAVQALENLEHHLELKRINDDLLQEEIAHKAAEQERKRLEQAVEQTSESILISNLDGIILYVNPAFSRITGFTREEALGSVVHDLTDGSTNDGIREAMRRQLATGAPWSGRLVKRRKDGSSYHEETTISPIRDETGRYSMYVSVSRDMTRMLQMEEQLRQHQKLESIGQLAAGIAHEINTPIQFIGDNARFLSDAFAELHEAIQDLQAATTHLELPDNLVAAIRKAQATVERVDLPYLMSEIPRALSQTLDGVQRVSLIVRAMKEFSHPGGQGLTPTDINRAIQNTSVVSRNEWKYVATLELDLDATLPPVPVYFGEFNQVILNIIVNAAHAISDQRKSTGSDALGKISITTSHTDSDAIIVLEDTGCGMSESVKKHVFEPFFTTKEVGRGTGQGLTLARTLITKRLHGSISFESVEGKGTTFTISIPLEPSARESHHD